jgi:hypothetical protein
MKLSKLEILYIITFLVLTGVAYPSWQLIWSYRSSRNPEKENLSPRPELSAKNIKDFPKSYESFLNDRLPYRDQLVSLNSAKDYYLFRSPSSDKVAIEKKGWLYYVNQEDGDPVSNYEGRDLLTEAQLKQIAENLETAQNYFKERDIEFVLFIAPNKERVCYDNLPDYFGRPAENYGTQQIVDYLRRNTDIEVVYPIDELMEARKKLGREVNLYHPTDAHWNDLGAYIGTTALLKQLGINLPSYDSSKVTITKSKDTPGDCAGILNLTTMIDPGDNYSVQGYTGNDMVTDEWDYFKIFRYHTHYADTRKIMIRRDSFCSAMAPVIGSQFRESVMVHNFADYSRDMVDREKPDIYVLETVERYSEIKLLDINYIY